MVPIPPIIKECNEDGRDRENFTFRNIYRGMDVVAREESKI